MKGWLPVVGAGWDTSDDGILFFVFTKRLVQWSHLPDAHSYISCLHSFLCSLQSGATESGSSCLFIVYQRCRLSTHLNPLLASLGKILSSPLTQMGRLGPRVEKQSQVLEPASGRGGVSDHFVITLAMTDAPGSSRP